MNKTTFQQVPDVEALFQRNLLMTGPGLRSSSSGGRTVITPEITQPEITRLPRPEEGGTFAGVWKPSRGASDTELNVTGGTINDGTTTHIIADAALTVHATSLNYIYLSCALTPTLTDGYVSGGTVDATPTIISSTSVQSNTNSAAYILLCTWQAGALVLRAAWFPYACRLGNSGTGDTLFQYWIA